jgi:beta-1,4-mannooligosaccharide/beta-1,4-mannosyl-N-acetylglucosamine phosphorylase
MIRADENPILTREHIPEIPPHLVDVTSVFNPGAVKKENQTLLMLRVQNRGRETFFLLAKSRDGVRFEVSNRPVHFQGIEKIVEPVYHCYDPRITYLDGVYYVLFAMDMDNACRLGLGSTRDFKKFTFMGIVSEEDNRNGVLFSEKIGGRYLRLDRPNRVKLTNGPTTGDTIYLSQSDDLLHWQPVQPVISARFHYWDELVGAGPPPIKTREGWVQIYHGVAYHLNTGIYQAGVVLLDLKNPGKVLGRGKYNILEPRAPYELAGQVPNVVFPSGAIPEEVDDEGFASLDSRVFVYYGAADTTVCLAMTTIQKLIDAARNE